MFTKRIFLMVSASLSLFLAPSFSQASIVIDDVMPHLRAITGVPMTMLNVSRDHQLFYRAYNDYTDLDGDGVLNLAEKTYLPTNLYYGYFESKRCYEYSAGDKRFNPSGQTRGSYFCNGKWSGNFLNWATMTRMDVVRKILYGGYRIIDTPAETVLERAHLPTDAHAFAKFYDGEYLSQLTPYSYKTGLTLCSSTPPATAPTEQIYSHKMDNRVDNKYPPTIRLAEGNYALWASSERWQCTWADDFKGVNVNGNEPAESGDQANPKSPSKVGSSAEFVARVKVCAGPDADKFQTDDELSRCKKYVTANANSKPIGLLHLYGENAQNEFGLITGSYSKNISGGILRRNVGPFADPSDSTKGEVNLTTGVFKMNESSTFKQGIVWNLDQLKIYGYDYGMTNSSNDGTYIVGDGCRFQRVGFTYGTVDPNLALVGEGTCSSWGNPIGTMYLEALRYFAGKTATASFALSNGSKDSQLGLTVEPFRDPFMDPDKPTPVLKSTKRYGPPECRPINVVNFNASVSSYDANPDSWKGFKDLPGDASLGVDSFTNAIGRMEGFDTGKWSVGQVDKNDTKKLCTAKSITNLADVTGICPEAPSYDGSYKMAGAAYYARTTPLREFGTKTSKLVNTYSVALATSTPRIRVVVDGKVVFIQPAYRLDRSALPTGTTTSPDGQGFGGGTLVNFRLVDATPETSPPTPRTWAKYIVIWEDSGQGGDYDQDLFGTLEYRVVNGKLTVATKVISYGTGNPQGFGYIITGVTGKNGRSADGPHFHSGILGFKYTDIAPPESVATDSKYTFLPSRITDGGCDGCRGSLKFPLAIAGTKTQPAKDAGPPDGITTATYSVVGAVDSVLENPLFYAAKYGNFTNENGIHTVEHSSKNKTIPLDPSLWDVKRQDGSPGLDTIPDAYFYATKPAELERSLRSIFGAIAPSGGAAPANSSPSISANSRIYLTTYSSKADSYATGDIAGYAINPSDGTKAVSSSWNPRAGAQIAQLAKSDKRVIITNSQGRGVPFRGGSSSKLSIELKRSLNIDDIYGKSVDTSWEQRLRYLRGDQSQEGISTAETPTQGFRVRASLLGDIINSTPAYIAAPRAAYSEALYPGYREFFINKRTRKPVVYVGANDGMLHGFSASTVDNGDAGKELFAFVPAAVYPNLTKLTNPAYDMRPYVDGPLMQADVNVGGWKTFLIGSTGRGAQSLYALDVSTPDTFMEEEGAAGSPSKVFQWEFSDADDVDMGHIISTPTASQRTGQSKQIVRLQNGKWALIMGNGYGSDNTTDANNVTDSKVGAGSAVLYIIYLTGPTDTVAAASKDSFSDIKKWKLGVDYLKIEMYSGECKTKTPTTQIDEVCRGFGPDNGLGIPTAVDIDNDGKVDWIYAPDIKGNIWKVDMRDLAAVKYERLYSAKFKRESGELLTQPITSAIAVSRHTNGGLLLNFITGKLYNVADLSEEIPQAIYGIRDRLMPNTSVFSVDKTGTAQLEQRGADGEGKTTVSTDGGFRRWLDNDQSKKVIDWKAKDGWFYILPGTGEKGIFNPYLDDIGNVVFDSVTDVGVDNCGVLPNVAISVLNAQNGTLPELNFDTNGDQSINKDDVKVVGVVVTGGTSGSSSVSISDPRQDSRDIVSTTTDKGVARIIKKGAEYNGRIFWRELIRGGQ